MNCVEGDFAVIIADSSNTDRTAGVFCDVLYRASYGDCILPDGTPSHYMQDRPGWVIKLHSPVFIKWADGSSRRATYACCPDAKLRPIRNQPGEDETFEWAPSPTQKELA